MKVTISKLLHKPSKHTSYVWGLAEFSWQVPKLMRWGGAFEYTSYYKTLPFQGWAKRTLKWDLAQTNQIWYSPYSALMNATPLLFDKLDDGYTYIPYGKIETICPGFVEHFEAQAMMFYMSSAADFPTEL
jgi:hypothetical protein